MKILSADQIVEHLTTELAGVTLAGIVQDIKVSRGTETQPVLVPGRDLIPQIFVGHHEIKGISNIETEYLGNEYSQMGQVVNHSFYIQLGCYESDFEALSDLVSEAMAGWNPQPADANFSSFSYIGGGVLGLQNSLQWWVDNWVISYPAISN